MSLKTAPLLHLTESCAGPDHHIFSTPSLALQSISPFSYSSGVSEHPQNNTIKQT
jgi:hypothetical protein